MSDNILTYSVIACTIQEFILSIIYMTQLTTLCSLFLIMGSGLLAKKLKLFDSSVAKEFNKFIYYFAIPAVTFISLADSKKDQFENYFKFIALNSIAIIFCYLLLLIILKVFKYEYSKGGAILYSSLTGSNIYFAFPIILGLYGQEYLNYAIIYIVFVIVVSDLSGFILLGLYKEKLDLKSIKDSFLDILKNPVVFASLLGVLSLLLSITIPEFLRDSLNTLSNTTTGLALFSLGIYIASNFSIKGIKYKEVTICSIYKLGVLPLVVLLVFTLFPSSSEIPLRVSVLQAAMPSAAFAVVVSDMFKLDREVTAQSILFTSLLFLLTSVFWINVL
jgi:predicted permease